MAPGLTTRRVVALALGAALLAAGCAGAEGSGAPSVPPVATQGATRAELVRVLGTKNLVLGESQAQFRPPEDPTFTRTPRALYQVILPKAPQEGFIVVYEFPDPTTAANAAAGQAAYLATGPAKVQSPFGARHIIRLVGPTVVVYTWVPAGAEDPLQPDIQTALETLGTEVPVPS